MLRLQLIDDVGDDASLLESTSVSLDGIRFTWVYIHVLNSEDLLIARVAGWPLSEQSRVAAQRRWTQLLANLRCFSRLVRIRCF